MHLAVFISTCRTKDVNSYAWDLDQAFAELCIVRLRDLFLKQLFSVKQM